MTKPSRLISGLLHAAVIATAVLGVSGCVVYEQPVPYYAPAATYSATPTAAPAEQNCREYRTTATIDGKPQEIHGRACLQPDGTWQYMR
jgi:surface antigen